MSRFHALISDKVTELERENQKKVRAQAGECMVLLENDGALPLSKNQNKLALFGNGARHTIKGGTGSGDVNTREVITVEQGLEAAGITITSKQWLQRYDEVLANAKVKYHEEIMEIAEREHTEPFQVTFGYAMKNPEVPVITKEELAEADCDTAVYVIARNSGEGTDHFYEKGDYLLSDGELANIQILAEHFEKCIVLLNTGGILDTSKLKAIKGVNAILIVGQSGNIGGYIVADVLTGQSIPSGKLVDTWAASYEDYPSSAEYSHNNGNVEDEYYKEGIYVGYRYFDTFNITPSYCFGYGKTYTDFSMETLSVKADENDVTLQVAVTNIGHTFSGKEVVQVYYSAPDGKLEKPYQVLGAFAKTKLLTPGEKEILTITYPTTNMASYDPADAAYKLEEGEYLIRVGNSSRNTKVEAVLFLAETVITEKLRNAFSDTEDFNELGRQGVMPYQSATEDLEISKAVQIALPTMGFTARTAIYQKGRVQLTDHRSSEVLTLEDVKSGRATVEELTAQLTVEEMAALCVGRFPETVEGKESIIGTASVAAPGAAADTIDTLMESRKIPNLILADGPAGLRLQSHFITTKDGELLNGGQGFGDETVPFPEVLPEGAVHYYQYCTAIPIATNLSQSWNMDLIREMGAIVGQEMEQFHVDLWLAPGMNIHRNPLCGRNFEYYSEDPLLSGKCAAADTQGVQGTGHHGTTIKHFAGNNQEDNRMFCNSHIKERALREVYLKGFEIAIKEAQPYSLMTSYNLLNGTHAANQYDLIQTCARDEWGFKGVVMTDWFTADEIDPKGAAKRKYPHSSSALCIAAGNDLIMPGNPKNIQEIIAVVKAGKETTLADLQFCVTHIISSILACQ